MAERLGMHDPDVVDTPDRPFSYFANPLEPVRAHYEYVHAGLCAMLRERGSFIGGEHAVGCHNHPAAGCVFVGSPSTPSCARPRSRFARRPREQESRCGTWISGTVVSACVRATPSSASAKSPRSWNRLKVRSAPSYFRRATADRLTADRDGPH